MTDVACNSFPQSAGIRPVVDRGLEQHDDAGIEPRRGVHDERAAGREADHDVDAAEVGGEGGEVVDLLLD